MPHTAKPPGEVLNTLSGLGQRIAVARKTREWTQADLSDRAGISRSTLVEIEKGSPYVIVGNYLSVLWALNLLSDVGQVASLGSDAEALRLLQADLPRRVRPRQ